MNVSGEYENTVFEPDVQLSKQVKSVAIMSLSSSTSHSLDYERLGFAHPGG